MTTPSGGLATYAMDEASMQGRRFFEPPHPYRSDYQRDRDRIIHSKAFRRLEKKTQVFEPEYSDHFRNRLTHTIEVSQIARTLAIALRLEADLVEVLALSHDIGHPPFSHEGESVLDRLMRGFGSGFDHNLHALTIVEDFEQRYASFRGLNLTFEVREGIVKHSRDYGKGADLYVDLAEYRLGERPPLEAQLIDLADEVAYNTADLDDGYESGLLPLDQLLDSCSLVRSLFRENERRFPQAEVKILVRESIRNLVDRLATSIYHGTEALLRVYRVRSLQEVRDHPTRLVVFDDENEVMNQQIKSFLRANLYNHPVLRGSREKAGKVIRRLFEHYMGSPRELPESHYRRLETVGAERVVCNYIAGMTDSFALATHRRLFGESGG